MPSFSLAALTALELPPSRLVEVAAACGYDQVGFRLFPAAPGGRSYPLMDDPAQLRETKARLAATGVCVADLEVVAFRPETDVQSLEAFLQVGRELGAKHTLVAAYDPDLGRFSDRFAEYCEVASCFGLTADLEFMPWTYVPDLQTAVSIVEKVDSSTRCISTDPEVPLRTSARFRCSGCTTGRCATRRPRGRRRPKNSFMPPGKSACSRGTAVSTCSASQKQCRRTLRSASRFRPPN